MDTRDDILNELRELHSGLANLPLMNVFTVPQGYFDAFADSVMRTINGDAILQTIAQPKKTNVPEGYFDTLADSIMGKIRLQQTVADDADETLSPLLQQLKNKNVFEVPDGYFDGLAGNITAQMDANKGNEELEPLPVILQGLQSKNVFEVPDGYFDGLATTITGKLKPSPAKVVKLGGLRVVKYAVAAAFIGTMALGIYKYAQPTQPVLDSVQQQGIALSKDDNQYNTAFDQVSDEAIVKFLENNGQDVDAVLAAAAVDEKDLPTEDELLLDDNTLDNFLNDIDDKNLTN
jgi:hypothetical protein